MKILMIGGTFDHTEGKPSKLVNSMAAAICRRGHEIDLLVNGGNVGDLHDLIDEAGKHDVVLWFPNVPNNYGKNIVALKQLHPKVLLVTSKRNDDGKYSFGELIYRALGLKANLTVEFWKFGNRFQGRVFDPLGCVWGQSEDFGELTDKLFERVEPLLEITRIGSHCLGDETRVPIGPGLPDFYEIVKDRATTFHDLIHPAAGVERFLGNASFRCERGFPSFRHDDAIYVSRRNVDKRFIGPDAFVRVEGTDEGVGYYGGHKPSVDAPVQMQLYAVFPKVQCMLHAHAYAKDAPFTAHAIPCGALEEVNEVVATFIDKHTSAQMLKLSNFTVNLRGHGSIVFAESLDYLRSVEYYAREIPEELA